MSQEVGRFPSQHLFVKSKPSFKVIWSAIRKLPSSSLRAASADLQLLGTNFYRRWRYDNSLLTRSIGNRFNHPLPARMAIFVGGPSCATAVPDLHSPMIVVGRNCKHIRDRGRDHHAAQHSNQKYSFHFQSPHSFILLFLPWRVRWILPCHSGAISCSLFWINAFPHISLYSKDRSSVSSWFLASSAIEEATSMCKRRSRIFG